MGEAGTGRGIAGAIDGVVAERVLPELLRRHAPPLLDARTIAGLADLAQDGGEREGALRELADDPGGRGSGSDAALLAAVLAALPRNGNEFGDGGWLGLLCRAVLEPVAIELGERWVRDDISFAAVTVGAGRLHAVLRAVSGNGPAGAWHRFGGNEPAPRLLLLPTPGETHRLGLSMAAELFREAGWTVRTGEPADGPALEALLDGTAPDLAGFSCACDRAVPALAEAVSAIRRLRPLLPVMAGGPVFARRPGLRRRLGLDAAFTDGPSAPARALALLRDRRLPGAAWPSTLIPGRLPHREAKVVSATGGRSVSRRPSGTGQSRRGGDPQDRAGGG